MGVKCPCWGIHISGFPTRFGLQSDGLSASPSGYKPWGHYSTSQGNITYGDIAPTQGSYPYSTDASESLHTYDRSLPATKFAIRSLMSALNPTVITYVMDMVRRQVWQQEREAELAPTISKPYLFRLNEWSPHQTVGFRNSECSTAQETVTSTSYTSYREVGPF